MSIDFGNSQTDKTEKQSNMGRYYYDKKDEADSLKQIEIWWLQEKEYLDGYKYGTIQWTGGWGEKSTIGVQSSVNESDAYIRFIYTQTDRSDDTKKDFDYKVPLVTTPCNFGGKRYWFKCCLRVNGIYCGRRVGVLYKGGDYFGCRHCYRLTYSCRNQPKRWLKKYPFNVLTLGIKSDKIREKIKREYYAGRPTRNLRRLLKIARKMGIDTSSL